MKHHETAPSQTMLREQTVFGPIHSRRLGNSLGINLLPVNGKICNFDCIYCECGWNADGRDDTVLPTAAQVRSALEDKLSTLMLDGVHIDSITFSGDGEPTLNPDFPRIIEDTLKLRDAYYPGAKVSVLSNATRVHVDAVFQALTKVDNPILKLDAPTDALAALINRPAPGYSVAATVEALKRFRGNFILQTMFLRARKRSLDGPAPEEFWFDSSRPEVLLPWMDIVRQLRPRQVQVYSIDRPTPSSDLVKIGADELRTLVQPLLDEGLNVLIR